MATAKVKFNEKTSGTISGTLADENGTGIDGATLETLFGTIYMRGDPAQRLRTSVDLLADPRFTITSAGVFTWTIRAEDTELLDADLAIGSSETHTVYLEFSGQSADSGTLTNPFATTAAAAAVTVNHTAHGLAVGDTVVFNTAENAGGLDLDGCYTVKSVDTNSYTIQHKTAATSTDATAGGAVSYYYNGQTSSDELFLIIKHVDPT